MMKYAMVTIIIGGIALSGAEAQHLHDRYDHHPLQGPPHVDEQPHTHQTSQGMITPAPLVRLSSLWQFDARLRPPRQWKRTRRAGLSRGSGYPPA